MCALPICPLQKDDPTPLYLQLQKILRDAIAGQVVKAEEAIPTERDLAEEFEVSRITVRKALDGLVAAGLGPRRRGAGTLVHRPRVDHSFSQLPSFSEEMVISGSAHPTTWLR